MYRFLLRPRWILSHLLVLALVVTMVNLGLWQLRRLDERQERNALIEERAELPTAPIGELADPSDGVHVGEELVWRSATATGTYVPDEEVLVRSRSLDGRPGFWVLTPLALDDGSSVVVNRGWIPFEVETDGSDVAYELPGGTVTVTGLVQESRPGPRPAGDQQVTVARPDLEWIEGRSGLDLYPVLIRLRAQEPPAPDLPQVLDPPELGEGPHLGYAVQWFIFTTIAVVGYPVILVRVARQRRQEAEAEAEDATSPPEPDAVPTPV